MTVLTSVEAMITAGFISGDVRPNPKLRKKRRKAFGSQIAPASTASMKGSGSGSGGNSGLGGVGVGVKSCDKDRKGKRRKDGEPAVEGVQERQQTMKMKKIRY